jgi:hypothetical protein
MQHVWMTTKALSIVHDEPGTFVLVPESDFAERAMSVGFFFSKQTREEGLESVETFRKGEGEGNAYLLADEPLIPERHTSRVGLLVEHFTKAGDPQAWVYLTLAVGETEEAYKAEKSNWLVLHENLVSEGEFSGRDLT